MGFVEKQLLENYGNLTSPSDQNIFFNVFYMEKFCITNLVTMDGAFLYGNKVYVLNKLKLIANWLKFINELSLQHSEELAKTNDD